MKLIMWEKLTAVYQDCEFLSEVFDNYFQQLYPFFKPHTSNINEFEYIFRFLYPRYI